jgi:hypothetical protein
MQSRTDLFTRGGKAFAGTPQMTEKGKPYHVIEVICSRCGGQGGGDQWKFTGWTCYQCGGRRTMGTRAEPLYTSDELAKLNARQAKANATRQAKAQAKAAASEAAGLAKRNAFQAQYGAAISYLETHGMHAGEYRDGFLGSLLAQFHKRGELSVAQLDALAKCQARAAADSERKANARHVGTIGERITLQVTVAHCAGYERRSFSGYGTEWVSITTMRDAAGNLFVVKSPRFSAEKGSTVTITGTVKEHGEYNGEAQTVLQRVTVKGDA